MERRVTSHTEEEEMNQRRHLLNLARKGDQKAINKLFELYQVKLYTGEYLKRKKGKKTNLTPSRPAKSSVTRSKEAKPKKAIKLKKTKTKVKTKRVSTPRKKALRFFTVHGSGRAHKTKRTHKINRKAKLRKSKSR